MPLLFAEPSGARAQGQSPRDGGVDATRLQDLRQKVRLRHHVQETHVGQTQKGHPDCVDLRLLCLQSHRQSNFLSVTS